MKRIMITLALAAVSVMALNAQKSDEALKKAVDSAKAACENPKKAENPATWLKLANAYMDVYKTAALSGVIGMNKAMNQQTMGTVKPISTTTETIGDETFDVEVYRTCKYYYSGDVLRLIVVTKPAIPTALDDALVAFEQAAKVDPQGKKTAEIQKGIKSIADTYNNDGAAAFSLKNFSEAATYFEKAVLAAATEPLAEVDTAGYYNTALSADLAGDTKKAIRYYNSCKEYRYLAKGNVFARLSDCLKQEGDEEGSLKSLEDGFTVFPDNQVILVGLINTYRDKGEDPKKILGFLDMAKVNDPKNASLYYVEGEICYKQLKDPDRAIAAYDKCSEIDPKYPFGEIGKAIIYNDQATEIQDIAQKEFNDQKYQELVGQFEAKCLQVIESFEKAFAVTEDKELKKNVAEYLKSYYYRFRDKSPEYLAAYEKYADIAKNGIQ